MAFLANSGLTFRSIKVYISGIRHWQIASGLPELFKGQSWPKLEYVLKGIRQSQAERLSPAQKDRLPITSDILRRIKRHWASQKTTVDIHVLWAAFSLGFFGFLRAGKFTVRSDSAFDPSQHLCPVDISVDSHEHPSLLKVQLKQSKTDPFRQGIDIFLGRSKSDLCPVSAVLSYLVIRAMDHRPLF